MSPYLEMTEFAETVNKLAVLSNENNMEVRCIMPRFGVINERRHRLHEVVRLSGINVTINHDDYPLIIKVASLPNARLQVYFLDNEDFFKRKSVFVDEHDEFFEDNGYDYDGIYVQDSHENITTVVFNPNQVKSAIGNNGNYSLYSNDINEKIKF